MTVYRGSLWDLTSAGKRRLTIARRDGPIELPESPQHREWRTAAGEHRIGRLRDDLETALDHADAARKGAA